MSTPLNYLLIAIVAFSVLVGTAFAFIGGPLLRLAFLDSDRDQPYLLLSFGEQTLNEQDRSFTLAYMPEGIRQDRPDALTLIDFDQASDVVRAATDQDIELGEILLGTYEFPSDPWQGTLVIWLAQASDDQLTDPLSVLSDVWRRDFHVLRGPDWQYMAVQAFANEEQATAYLTAEQTKLNRTLMRARTKRLSVLVFNPA